jgi:hypothetical protein
VDLIEPVTFGLAVLGSVLGVINTMHSLWKDRVRLKVALRGWVGPNAETGMCVEVVNLSSFEITISELSVPLGWLSKEKYVAPHQGGYLSERLQPRAAHTFVFRAGALEHPGCPKHGRFRVITACGVMKTTNRAQLH